MKNFKKILSCILVTAISLSTAIMCLPVSAETATETTWTLDSAFSIGADGSAATLENGQFTLGQDGKTLDGTVTAVNGVASIVNTEGKRAFSKSDTGIIDITPATGTRSYICFTAPLKGKYNFEVEVVKTDMSGLPADAKVKNWVEIGPRTSVDSTYAAFPGLKRLENYDGKAIGNADNFTETSLTLNGVVTLSAGQVIVLAINNEGNTDETQTTVKKFTVTGEVHVCSDFKAATCQSPAVCRDCGEPSGEVDPDNHVSVAYTDNGDGTHKAVYDCCDVVKDEHEAHVYAMGLCGACRAKQADQKPPVSNGDNNDKGPDTTLIIIIAAAAVVVIGGAVAGVVIAKKKKAKK